MTSPLMTVDQLERILGHDDVRLVDCRWYLDEPARGAAEYRLGHIPGAVYASLDDDLSGTVGPGRHPLPPPEDFAETLARLGVAPSTTVVAYDDRGGAIASRLWWMLRDQGHEMAFLLDGGLQSWTSAGNHLSTSDDPPETGKFTARPWRDVIDRSAVVSRQCDAILVDARSLERYRGDEEPVDPKAGHIPGAISLSHADNLTADLSFLSPAELHSRFTHAGIVTFNEVIVHCGSGVTACHNILAMEIAGIERPLLYVGSWSDWSSEDLPVATGDAP